MTITPFTITSSPAMQAAEAVAELQHLADTAAADQALLADDAGPDWRAVEHAEHKLAFIDADATAAVKLLDGQNDARGREIQRLRAQLATAREQALAEAANHLDSIAKQVEDRVAEYYGQTSGIGPGSADMVREAARTVRALAAQQSA